MAIRLGIIGAGGIGQMHAEAATRAGSTVAGFCDTDGDRARGQAARYDGAFAVTSAEEMLDRDDVEAVVVAVPNVLHKGLAIQAIESGKDLLLEKPMAMSAAECDEILAVSSASDRIVQLGFVCRYAPTTIAVQRCIESGRLGRIYSARAQLYRRRGIPGLGGWFTTKAAAGGGVLIDLGVHLVDLVMHLTGRPPALRASAACTSTFGHPIGDYTYGEMWAGPPREDGVFDVEDAATGLIRFGGGLTMDFSATWAANVPEDMLPAGVILMGEKGGCFFEVWGEKVRIATEADGQLVDLVPHLPPGDPWAAAWTREHEVFAEAVRSRARPGASPEDGRAVQAILEALYRSSAEGREVEIS